MSSFVDGIGYPGITLAGGQSTGSIDLAIVNLQLFDPSLVYPSIVKIVLDAISVDPATALVSGIITENDASIKVQAAVPEPSSRSLLVIGLLLIFSITALCCSLRRHADTSSSGSVC